MSSARSGANVRSKRPPPQQEPSYARPQSGPGPVTSINSQQIFNNSGANTTGANARINGPRGATSSSQSTQNVDSLNPPQGSKLTIGNAVALITLRLGRLESFMHHYELEDLPNNADNDIMKSVLTRLSALERTSSTDGSTQLILNRLNTLETSSKEITVKMQETALNMQDIVAKVREPVFKSQHKNYEEHSVLPSSLPVATASLEQHVALRTDIESLHEELRETKDLLLKLQAFTMETNAKLINTIFCPIDQFDVMDFENANDDINKYELGDDELLGGAELDEDFDQELEGELDAEGHKESDEESVDISVNLKELISQELLGM